MTEREFLYVLEDGKAGVSMAVQLQPFERDGQALTARAYVPYEWPLVWTVLRACGELVAHEERLRTEPRFRFDWKRKDHEPWGT